MLVLCLSPLGSGERLSRRGWALRALPGALSGGHGDGEKAGRAGAGRMLLVLKGTWSDGSWRK